MSTPTVTVLIPARDEAEDIGDCLAAVAASDIPSELVEVVVVDGGSVDATALEASRAGERLGLDLRVIANPTGSTPSNLNAGLAEARGATVCRVDARSLIPPDYVRRCVEVLDERPEVVVVGGRQVAAARGRSRRDRAIARALNNRWGMGLSKYRRAAASGPADTVYLGAFRTDDLRRVGGWDERFPTNQDFELNRRLGAQGVLWFDGSLAVGYRPRATIGALFAQYHRFGRWKVRYWRLTGDRPRPRQVVLLVAPVVLVGAAVIAGRRWPKAIAVAAPLGLAGAVAVEWLGGPADEPAGPLDHVMATVALASTSTGWLSGIGREALAGRAEPAHQDKP